MDIQNFYRGTEFYAQDHLGAHATQGGVVFRTFAPAADGIVVLLDDGPHEIFKRRDELSDMGLSVPPIAEIAQKISDKHKDFESNPLTIGELADDIKEYRKTNR